MNSFRSIDWKTEDMDKLLESYNLPRLNLEEIENLNRLVTNTEIEKNIKTSSKEKNI